MAQIYSSVACNLDVNVLSACIPLFEQSQIEAIEWSFDALFDQEKVPEYFLELLKVFSENKRLIGHGIFFSIFAGKLSDEQQHWLSALKKISAKYSFDHISEHFGFLTGSNFHHGAPLSVPYSDKTLRIGRDRLARIYEACHCPVGLENLAFSYSIEAVKVHGEFLDNLLDPINGFIILDLHNLFCQIHNFNIPFEQLINLYPLEKVREIHISGGSWEDSATNTKKKIRRDTHDNCVPLEVFELLELVIQRCTNLKYVVLEQVGAGLKSEESKSLYQKDYLKMKELVNRNDRLKNEWMNDFLPTDFNLPAVVTEDEELYNQQNELSYILENSSSLEQTLNMLKCSTLFGSTWKIETWDECLIETARSIANKWKKGP